MQETVLEALSQKMRCGVFTNARGQILIVYDQEIPAGMEWVEYDRNDRALFLVHEGGVLQSLGVGISRKMDKNLINGAVITLARVVYDAFRSVQTVTLIIKDYGS